MPRKRAKSPVPDVPYNFTPGEHEAEPEMVHAGPISPVLYETESKNPIVPDPSALRNVQPVGAVASRPPASPPLDTPAQVVTYQSRIRVMDAWQYAGSLRDAPDFVDRNWAGFEDGPVLRVPHYARPDGDPVVCRVLDYVVRQEVKLADGVEAMERIEVWQREEFERLFIPQRISGTDPATRKGPKAPSPDLLKAAKLPADAKANLQELLDDLDPPGAEGEADEPAAA